MRQVRSKTSSGPSQDLIAPHNRCTIDTMSYIIAFVQFVPSGDTYPVECFRTDVSEGDAVLVQLPKRLLTQAAVHQVRYLSWTCVGRIRGKVSEAEQAQDGYWSLRDCPAVVGMATNEVFVAELKRRGWIPMKRGHVHMATLTNSNKTTSANILVRRNGIDLQMLPGRRSSLPRPFSLSQESVTEGRFVRHYFSHTTFNLYEGVLRFADTFMSDEVNYDRFFKSVGQGDRRNEALKEASKLQRELDSQRKRDSNDEFDVDYYIESNGGGDRAYLGDGMWVTSGGRFVDSGS